MTPTNPNEDPLSAAIAGLGTNDHWRHYVKMLATKREQAISDLLGGPPGESEMRRGRARAYDEIIQTLKRHGVKI